jgi:Tol biopolymer transport system component
MKKLICSGWTIVAMWLAFFGLAYAPLANAQKFSDWGPPVNLGQTINFPGANTQHPAISRNGLSLYFSSDRPEGSGMLDLWVSQRPSVNDSWGVPQNLGPNINSAATDSAPNLTPDGHFLYFYSGRPGGCGPAGTDDLYVSHRRDKDDDFAWEPPVNLGCTINGPFNDAGPTFFHDRETDTTYLYFTSTRPGGPGNYDIYVSILDEDGNFGPGILVPELSSPFRDTRTAIRKDGLEIILSSGRPGGVGSEDLWVSTRDDTEDPWSTPVNLGPIVNSPSFDGAPALSWDGTTLYFFSERPGGIGKRDLYVTTRNQLPHKYKDSDNNDSKKE